MSLLGCSSLITNIVITSTKQQATVWVLWQPSKLWFALSWRLQPGTEDLQFALLSFWSTLVFSPYLDGLLTQNGGRLHVIPLFWFNRVHPHSEPVPPPEPSQQKIKCWSFSPFKSSHYKQWQQTKLLLDKLKFYFKFKQTILAKVFKVELHWIIIHGWNTYVFMYVYVQGNFFLICNAFCKQKR